MLEDRACEGLSQWVERCILLPEPTWTRALDRIEANGESDRWSEASRKSPVDEMVKRWPFPDRDQIKPWDSVVQRSAWAAGFGEYMAARGAAIAALASVEVSWWAMGNTDNHPQFPLAALAAASSRGG